jgi:subtilisin family serine protease
MKFKFLLFAALAIITTAGQSQSIPAGYNKVDAQLKHWLAQPQQLAIEQPAFFKNGPVSNPMIPVIFKATGSSVPALVAKVGGEVHTQIGEIYTAMIPLDAIVLFASNQEISRIEATAKVKVTDTKAKELTGADKVHIGQLPGGNAYTGKGVIVGVFDTGIDFSHPDFRKKTDNTQTRILSIWDQQKSGGTTPQNYNYGSEYTNAQINASLNNPHSLNTHDSSGHGTHVAGSAAGLHGMAPDAEIIFVTGLLNWDSDSTLYQDTKSLLDGLNYMKEKAAAAGKPCVVNLSVGYNLGSPHDGSSLVEQGFDLLVTNNSGFFIVVAAGNDNGKEMHFGGFELTQDSIWTYIKTGMLYSVFNSAYSDSTFISFGADSAVVTSADWESLSTQKPVFQSAWLSITTIKNTLNGISIPALYSNGDTAMMFHITASDFDANRTEVRIFTNHGREVYNDSIWDYGIAKLAIKGKGKLHAWWENYQINYISHPYWYANAYKNDRHRSSDDNYSMNILACGHKTIAVGAFVNQPSFINRGGQVQYGQNYDQDSSGVFAHFSSLGPTTDGRVKPDISAPGINVSSSFSRHAAYPIVWHVDNQTVALSGTSMAAPITTGAIALYLEKNPTATFEMVKAAIMGNAIVDTLVTKFGAMPNNHFGYGRLDIYKAMGGPFNTNVRTHKLPEEQEITAYPNPTTVSVNFISDTKKGLATIHVFDIHGKLIAELQQKDNDAQPIIDVHSWEKGLYIYSITVGTQTRYGKFIVQ